MTVPTTIADLSTTAADNAPQGHDSPDTLDNIQRAHGAFIKQLSTGTGFAAGNLAGITPGTGIATALAINAGSTGAPILQGGAAAVTTLSASGRASLGPSPVAAGMLTITPVSVNEVGLLVNDSGYGIYTSGGSTLNFNYNQDADGTGYINYRGYQNSTTRYRSLIIGDGKQGTIATFTGSATPGLAVTGTLSAAGTAIDFVTSGTVLTVGVGANNGTVSAGVFTDRTKAYTGDALAEIAAITHIDGEIDHSTLPAFAQVELIKPIFEAQEVLKPLYEAQETLATKEVDGTLVQVIETSQVQVGEETVTEQVKVGEKTVVERDIGAMISMLTVAVQQLTTRLEKLELTK